MNPSKENILITIIQGISLKYLLDLNGNFIKQKEIKYLFIRILAIKLIYKKIFQFLDDFIKVKSGSTYNIKDETETVDKEFVLDKKGNLLKVEKQYDYMGFNDGDDFVVSAVVYSFDDAGYIKSIEKI